MAARAEPEERPVRSWPATKRRTGAAKLDAMGLGRVVWVASTVVLTLAALASVRPLNFASRWAATRTGNLAVALADRLAHTKHRPVALPVWRHDTWIAGHGGMLIVLFVLAVIVAATWRWAPDIRRGLSIAGVTVAVLAVLGALAAFAQAGRTADSAVLRFVGATAQFVSKWVTNLEMR